MASFVRIYKHYEINLDHVRSLRRHGDEYTAQTEVEYHNGDCQWIDGHIFACSNPAGGDYNFYYPRKSRLDHEASEKGTSNQENREVND